MKIETVHPLTLPERAIKQAEPYNNVREMIKDGQEIALNGFIGVLGGTGLMLAGGSMSVLAGDSRIIQNTGKATWGAGFAITTKWGLKLRKGDQIEESGRKISSAVELGKAAIN